MEPHLNSTCAAHCVTYRRHVTRWATERRGQAAGLAVPRAEGTGELGHATGGPARVSRRHVALAWNHVTRPRMPER